MRRNLKWILNALAIAMLLFGPTASAQSCPPSEFCQSCGPFGSSFPGLPQWVGVCIASTCSSENPGDGAVSQQPYGFCEPVACPVPELGQLCDAGTCTQATCRGPDDAGNPTSQNCGVCIVPIPGCSSANLGAPCGEGGTCMTGTVRALGPAGAAPPADLFYSTPQCVVPLNVPDSGALEVDASIGATARGANGDSPAPVADGSGEDVSTSSRGSGGSSGCDVAAGGGRRTQGPRGIGLLFTAAALLVAMRRPGTASADSLPVAAPAAAVARRFGPKEASVLAGGAREGNVLPGGTATAHVRGSDDASPAPEAHAATVAPAIGVQLESIRYARALVASGDARAALVALDAYETRYPHGIFEKEAMALRVRALRMGGDAAGADRERTNLQSRFPKSVHLASLGN
ncbi:MAG: hypothetical protein WBY94_21195 [Polyangiaceae bacterium]